MRKNILADIFLNPAAKEDSCMDFLREELPALFSILPVFNTYNAKLKRKPCSNFTYCLNWGEKEWKKGLENNKRLLTDSRNATFIRNDLSQIKYLPYFLPLHKPTGVPYLFASTTFPPNYIFKGSGFPVPVNG